MDAVRDFRRLNAWERAHELVLAIYLDTKRFPASERFGLASQLRRASVSVPTNIAEGAGCSSRAEYCRFLGIAIASSNEVEYLLILSHDLGFLADTPFRDRREHVEEVRRKLIKLQSAIRAG